jgi:hypothetical protein
VPAVVKLMAWQKKFRYKVGTYALFEILGSHAGGYH